MCICYIQALIYICVCIYVYYLLNDDGLMNSYNSNSGLHGFYLTSSILYLYLFSSIPSIQGIKDTGTDRIIIPIISFTSSHITHTAVLE